MTGVRVEEAVLPVRPAATAFLATIVDTFAAYEIELPGRQLIAIGSVAVDEPVLAVLFGALSVGLPGNDMNSPVGYDRPRTMLFDVQLWREIAGADSPHAPKADRITAEAGVTMDDTWVLLEAAYAFDKANAGNGILASVSVLEPQGSTHGVALNVSLQVP